MPATTDDTSENKSFHTALPKGHIETPSTSNIITIDLADFDLSGEIDYGDVARLAEEWLWAGLPGTINEDIAVDGTVNFADYAKIAEKWLYDLR